MPSTDLKEMAEFLWNRDDMYWDYEGNYMSMCSFPEFLSNVDELAERLCIDDDGYIMMDDCCEELYWLYPPSEIPELIYSSNSDIVRC